MPGKLKLGWMSTRDIADWMGIAYGTFRNNAEKKLEKLELFADFEKKRGGVVIKYVYMEEFDKNATEDDKAIREAVKSASSKLMTTSGVRRKLKRENKKFAKLSNSWVDKKVERVLMKDFGPKGDEKGGTKGYRRTKWAIKVNDFNVYRRMTEEEEKLFKELVGDYFKEKPEIIIRKDELEADLKKGYIDKKEYVDEINKKDNFFSILQEFKSITGETLVRATEYILWEDEIQCG